MSRRRYNLLAPLLIAAMACVYLAGNGAVSLFDRDEPRYATASRHMAEHGDWVVPQFLGTPRTAKPIFIYWLQATAMRWLGPTDFAARLPSAIAMTLTLALLAVALPSIVGRRRGLWTIFVLATSTMAIVSAKMALTDATLLLFITASQLAFYRLWVGRRDWPTVAALGLAIGLAGLTKGPVVLGVLGTTALVLGVLTRLDRRGGAAMKLSRDEGTQGRRDEGVAPTSRDREGAGGLSRDEGTEGRRDEGAAPTSRDDSPELVEAREGAVLPASRIPPGSLGLLLRGLLILAIVVAVLAPWLVMIEQRLPGYLLGTLDREIVQRGTTGAEGHDGPPGFYLLSIWGTFFPWSLLMPAALVGAWRRRHVLPIRFALAAVVGPWLMLEFYVTKLPHYLLPAFPFLALLVADVIARSQRRLDPALAGRGFRVVAGLWPLLVGAGAALAWASLWLDPRDHLVVVAGLVGLSLVSIITAVYTSRRLLAGRVAPAAVSMGIGMALAMLIAWTLVLPQAEALRISPRVADFLVREDATRVGDVRMVDYKEPTLGFYQGGTIREEAEDRFFHVVPESQWPRWLVTTDRLWADAPADVRSRWIEVGSTEGIQYAAGGRRARVHVLRRVDGPADPASASSPP